MEIYESLFQLGLGCLLSPSRGQITVVLLWCTTSSERPKADVLLQMCYKCVKKSSFTYGNKWKPFSATELKIMILFYSVFFHSIVWCLVQFVD